MKNLFLVVLLFVGAFVLIISDFGKTKGVVYDCGMAEWHPDIPKEVKEECRKLHYENWKKNQEEKAKTKLISI